MRRQKDRNKLTKKKARKQIYRDRQTEAEGQREEERKTQTID